MPDLAAVRARALSCLAPPPVMQLSQWIEASVCLLEGLAAVPGPLRLYPYQREISECIGSDDYERVTTAKAARIGFSVLVAAAI
jgi:phage terminase large subunit GpA-like protein